MHLRRKKLILHGTSEWDHGYVIDPSHKSHNTPVPYHIMQHLVTEMCTYVHISVTKWCIVGYLSDALWDLWDGSIDSIAPHLSPRLATRMIVSRRGAKNHHIWTRCDTKLKRLRENETRSLQEEIASRFKCNKIEDYIWKKYITMNTKKCWNH